MFDCIMTAEQVELAFSAPPAGTESGTALSSRLWQPGQVITWWTDPAIPASSLTIAQAAMDEWSLCGNIIFEQVADRDQALMRIGVDGNNSFVGNTALTIPLDQDTMNMGAHGAYDVWLHEIGHFLGLSHEHQSPNSPLVYDTNEVNQFFMNSFGWTQAEIDFNVYQIRTNNDRNTPYDAASIMHYTMFDEWIISPEPYASQGISTAQDLSPLDCQWASEAYAFAPGDILFSEIDFSAACGPCGDPAAPTAPLYWEKSADGGVTWTQTPLPPNNHNSVQAGDMWRYVCPDGVSDPITIIGPNNAGCGPTFTLPDEYAPPPGGIIGAPNVSLFKEAMPANVTDAVVGDVIDYTFTVSNLGDVDLTGINITDLICPPVSGSTTLTPGQMTVFTCSYSITQADIDAGQVVNTATVTTNEGVSDTSTVTVGVDEACVIGPDVIGPQTFTFQAGEVMNFGINCEGCGVQVFGVWQQANPATGGFYGAPLIPVPEGAIATSDYDGTCWRFGCFDAVNNGSWSAPQAAFADCFTINVV